MKKKSILVTPDFPPTTGGIQTYLYELFSRVPGCEVLAPDYPELDCAQLDAEYPERVFRQAGLNGTIRSRRDYLLKVVFKALYRIWRGRYSLVHCGHVYPIGLIGYYAKKWLGVPYVVYTYLMEVVQLAEQPEPTRSRYLAVLREAESVVTISGYTKRKLLTLGVPEEKIRMIYPGANPQVFTPGERDPELVRRHGLDGKFVLLTAGRLVERKGHDRVIEAVGLLRERLPDLVYVIVGAGPHEQELRRLVREKGLDERVVFAGKVSQEDLVRYHRTADVFLTISREIAERGDVEGFGIVFLEAGACEKPVIGGNSGGVPDAVADGETGFLVDPNDVGALAGVIERLHGDDQLRRTLGQNGRRRVLEQFTWDVLAEQIRRDD
jgi:phosphatidylinositol alpha-1,6-mannosyltransferase